MFGAGGDSHDPHAKLRNGGTAAWPPGCPTTESTRSSRGLEQFVLTLREVSTTAVLDLGPINQENTDHVANLGHRILFSDMLRPLDSVWDDPDLSENRKIEEILDQTLNYPESCIGGAMVWDTFQHLPAPLLEAVVERLYYLLQPGGLILAFFHADEKARAVPSYSYRILDTKSMVLTPRQLRPREQFFNNRALERMFQNYAAVKFFLTRDHLREVIVRR